MAIDKEFLKKQNAKKVYEKRRKKSENYNSSAPVGSNSSTNTDTSDIHKTLKSTDFDFNRSSKSSANIDLNGGKDKKVLNRHVPKKRIARNIQKGTSDNTEKSENESVSESSTNAAYTSVRSVSGGTYKAVKKAVNTEKPQQTNISGKSKMLDGNVSKKPNTNNSPKKKKRSKKSRYKANRKKVYKKSARKVFDEKVEKQAVKKSATLCAKVLWGIVTFAASNYLLVLPVMLIIMLFTGASFSESDEIKYTYPASDVDITNTIELWQSLQVDIKNQHSQIPERDGIKGKFTDKKAEICEFMNDNDKLLSFVSAYKIPYTDSWHYEDISELVTDIFNEMYGLDAAIADNVLTYRIVEKKSWDDILKSYLNDEQIEKYNDYYEHKGGLVKALSSPFGFDWSGYITSPFGYRTWGDGSTEYHKGVDFGVPAGTPILSISDGVVQKICNSCPHNYPKDSSCGCGGGYGNYVDVLTDNGELFITYGHMESVYVNVGDKVKNGQIVGTVGCTGWSTGNHLHLETRSQTAYGELLDPLTIIKQYE